MRNPRPLTRGWCDPCIGSVSGPRPTRLGPPLGRLGVNGSHVVPKPMTRPAHGTTRPSGAAELADWVRAWYLRGSDSGAAERTNAVPCAGRVWEIDSMVSKCFTFHRWGSTNFYDRGSRATRPIPTWWRFHVQHASAGLNHRPNRTGRSKCNNARQQTFQYLGCPGPGCPGVGDLVDLG